jgi:endoglucanase
MNVKYLGIFSIATALAIVAFVSLENNPRYQVPLIFAPRTMLSGTWNDYKQAYVDESGRTIDRQRDEVTTSEGQSYTMLRAVWMDDRDTFEKAWNWTTQNLSRKEDNLFAWLYGKNPDGTFGVLSNVGGYNSASDADTDIALALIFAYSRWREPAYLESARSIVTDLWEHEVAIVNGKPVLAANNLEKSSESPTILVNPSYFAPYAYRIFSHLDPERDWNGLIENSYSLITRSSNMALDKSKSAKLPPDWFMLERNSGEIRPADSQTLKTTYGYEASRLPWRLALDWLWYREPRAKDVLSSFEFLREQWETGRALYATYDHDGRVAGNYEAPSMYGGSLGYFVVVDPAAGEDLYSQKLRTLYDPNVLAWREQLSYYDANWAWFGLALYHGFTPNLSPFEQKVSIISAAELVSYIKEYSFDFFSRTKVNTL